ncbi:MAG: hypothetical protein GX130_02320 [Candidatus Hydrogenedens sp.]|jgi:hypothetical protein|nr:hypothetical protein [Candidatus Hydrogenedens sp.]
MSGFYSDKRGKDPTRLCHVCRMSVSALAQRCRFCGATLQRPRKTDETLTVEDLGGETSTSYRPSANVVGALEAFAEEEKAQSRSYTEGTGKERSRNKQSSQSDARSKMEQALDELDPSKIDIYSVDILSRRPRESPQPTSSPLQSLGPKLLVIAAFFLGLIVLYFVADIGWKWFRSGRGTQQVVTTVSPNRAESMLAEGLPLLEVHREAIRALQEENSPENLRIIRDIRTRLTRYIEEEAYCNPFDMLRLSNANRDCSAAATVDFDQGLNHLADEIRKEAALFKFILTSVDADEGTAVFRLNNAYTDLEEQTVQQGDLLQDRFIVTGISSRGVALQDTHPKAEGRRLIAKTLSTVLPD